MKVVALALLAACSQPAPIATAPAQPVAAPGDASEASQEERLAAIQKAMNELDEAAQGCWAAAATDRFDIEGEVTLMIDIAETSSKASVVTDLAKNPKLSACLVQLLSAYKWAPPLYGQSIQLPFKFKAPDGQSVIDRRLVEAHGQGRLAVSVLLDENNTANDAASMFEVMFAKGGTTEWRKAERAELWYFLGPARVSNPENVMEATVSVAAGDMMFVPKGESRDVTAVDDMHAVVVVTPGGREGTARAGALPTPPAPASKAPPRILRASGAKTFGPATIYLDDSIVKGTPLAASVLKLGAGAKVPEHVHEHETEMLYVLEGAGTMTIAGQDVAVTETSVIQIPPNTKHAFAAGAAVRALQIYTPAGPEQRFKKK